MSCFREQEFKHFSDGRVKAGDSTLCFTVRKGAMALLNRVVLNRELSIQARGVLLVLCARPQGASMGYRALMGQGMGETALWSALRELEAAGHRWRFRLRRAGVVRMAVVVFVEPAAFEALHRMRWVVGPELGWPWCRGGPPGWQDEGVYASSGNSRALVRNATPPCLDTFCRLDRLGLSERLAGRA